MWKKIKPYSAYLYLLPAFFLLGAFVLYPLGYYDLSELF